MTIEEKNGYVHLFCVSTECELCPLRNRDWLERTESTGCLVIDESPESDLDRAIKIIEDFRNVATATDDAVNHPSHYTDGKIEVIEFIEDKNLGFHLGNAVKYISRAGKKDPNKTVEDLNKAKWYIERYIELIEVSEND